MNHSGSCSWETVEDAGYVVNAAVGGPGYILEEKETGKREFWFAKRQPGCGYHVKYGPWWLEFVRSL